MLFVLKEPQKTTLRILLISYMMQVSYYIDFASTFLWKIAIIVGGDPALNIIIVGISRRVLRVPSEKLSVVVID